MQKCYEYSVFKDIFAMIFFFLKKKMVLVCV